MEYINKYHLTTQQNCTYTAAISTEVTFQSSVSNLTLGLNTMSFINILLMFDE